ncbi:MAG: glutamate--cysteine ligase, partial [Gammaproteobacteria bacterium]
ELVTGWQGLREAARRFDADCVCTGILQTVRNEHLSTQFMSPLNRYYALNEQVLLSRSGRPIELDIVGHEHLHVEQSDVMLESATTSFQIHMQVPQDKAARYINASMVISAPLVALAANSPYLFGHDLWDETRIPVFEQAVSSGGFLHASAGPLKRITFGNNYVRESLWECFEENLDHYPILLPHDFGTASEEMAHLRLHNGTIWRWNRPLIGFDEQPHLRIEQRVVPSGPSTVDMVANMAFYYGLVETLAHSPVRPEMQLDFAISRDNFYQAARHGLDAHIQWLDGNSISVKRLILDKLMEMAWQGLEQLGISSPDIHQWLGIVEQRVISGQTGTRWQREYVKRHGADMHALLDAYRQGQDSMAPVHEWEL